MNDRRVPVKAHKRNKSFVISNNFQPLKHYKWAVEEQIVLEIIL